MSRTPAAASKLLAEFNSWLGVAFKAPPDLLTAAQAAVDGCSDWQMYPEDERRRRLIALINAKLKLNKDRLQAFLDAAAVSRVFPNYHEKIEILECLDYGDEKQFKRWLAEARYEKGLFSSFDPVTESESLEGLHELLRTGTVNRSDARDCSVDERQEEILRSLFGSYVFHAFPVEAMHRHFNADCRVRYHADFYQHLLAFHPQALHRDCALVYLRLFCGAMNEMSGDELRDALCSFIRETYDRLSNHCVLAIQIEPFREGAAAGEWNLFSDLVLYAEKHREVKLKAGYFHPRRVEVATAEHVPPLDSEQACFDIANEGFFFRDCFVLQASEQDEGPANLLLLFDKNERDETVIPCPGCRSSIVAGNSYPTLGVRSWECRNPICPDRSAFDRGNRYSLSSIIKQEAIKSDADQIPESSLRRWKLDVVRDVDASAICDMLVRHYSLHGDTVVFVNGASYEAEVNGRRVVHQTFDPKRAVHGTHARFQSSAFFKRFVVERDSPDGKAPTPVPHSFKDTTVYNGDCFEVLSRLRESSIDGAVTSPPYYNARSYSTWPNIYCYLYDMYNAARAVYRVLKPGSYYVFNIFDYFDNENIIVFSAMGKKRMILGAYIINLFRRVGFELDGNVAWFKGEIEGKRNYNQGNRSPYYQAPLNTWEHCFVFRKPGGKGRSYRFPVVLDAKPFYKIVRGVNVLGHTAPFPPDIPLLLISQMEKGECVLDPFSGSMTTGRTAYQRGLPSVSIELQKEYCELGLKLLNKDGMQLHILNNGSAKQTQSEDGNPLFSQSENSQSQGAAPSHDRASGMRRHEKQQRLF
jgi:DNA modification methylase